MRHCYDTTQLTRVPVYQRDDGALRFVLLHVVFCLEPVGGASTRKHYRRVHCIFCLSSPRPRSNSACIMACYMPPRKVTEAGSTASCTVENSTDKRPGSRVEGLHGREHWRAVVSSSPKLEVAQIGRRGFGLYVTW